MCYLHALRVPGAKKIPTRVLLAARERIPFGSTQDGCRALGRSVSDDDPNWSQAGSKFRIAPTGSIQPKCTASQTVDSLFAVRVTR
jgi:hypothetical protein